VVNLTDEEKKQLKVLLQDRAAMSRWAKKITLFCSVVIGLAATWVIFRDWS